MADKETDQQEQMKKEAEQKAEEGKNQKEQMKEKAKAKQDDFRDDKSKVQSKQEETQGKINDAQDQVQQEKGDNQFNQYKQIDFTGWNSINFMKNNKSRYIMFNTLQIQGKGEYHKKGDVLSWQKKKKVYSTKQKIR